MQEKKSKNKKEKCRKKYKKRLIFFCKPYDKVNERKIQNSQMAGNNKTIHQICFSILLKTHVSKAFEADYADGTLLSFNKF